MGCVPPERKQPAAVNAVALRKNPSVKRLDSNQEPLSTESADSKHLQAKGLNIPSFKSLPNRRGNSIGSEENNLNAANEMAKPKVTSKNEPTPASKKSQKEFRSYQPPNDQYQSYGPKVHRPISQDLTKQASINTLDIHSMIKSPTVKQTPSQSSPTPEIDITFTNNGLFASPRSASNPPPRSKRADILRRELMQMNEENFKRISIDSMNFN